LQLLEIGLNATELLLTFVVKFSRFYWMFSGYAIIFPKYGTSRVAGFIKAFIFKIDGDIMNASRVIGLSLVR